MQFTVTSTNGFNSPSPTPLEQKWYGMKLFRIVIIVNGNLKYENSIDYALKPQRNYMFMNSASVDTPMIKFAGELEKQLCSASDPQGTIIQTLMIMSS